MSALKRKHESPEPGETRPFSSSHLAAPRAGDDAHPFIGPQAKRLLPSPQTQNNKSPDEEFFRTLYLKEINFRKLAQRFPALLLRDGRTVDFEDPTSFMSLTKTLLEAHFNVKVELPDDRLCPPVPNRHNYILFLKELLDSSTFHPDPPSRACSGIDIGTGASAIYPLLGSAQRQWKFIATEADMKNAEYARRNVTLNGMQDNITILGPRDITGPLIPLGDGPGEVRAGDSTRKMEFLMTNPPFYESEEELLTLARQKARPPRSACTGAPVEMICQGGEVAFVSKIFIESLVWKDRIQWYTAMLGKLESVENMVNVLRYNDVDNYAVSGLVQGKKTKRWVIAWSFGPMRPSQGVSSGIKVVGDKKVAPAKVEEEVLRIAGASNDDGNIEKVRRDLLSIMDELDLFYWEVSPAPTKPATSSSPPHVFFEGVGRSKENIWSRAWRRRKARGEVVVEKATAMPPDGSCAFGFSILAKTSHEGVEVVVRWREGHDHVMFESFCGFLKRKLAELCDWTAEKGAAQEVEPSFV